MFCLKQLVASNIPGKNSGSSISAAISYCTRSFIVRCGRVANEFAVGGA